MKNIFQLACALYLSFCVSVCVPENIPSQICLFQCI